MGDHARARPLLNDTLTELFSQAATLFASADDADKVAFSLYRPKADDPTWIEPWRDKGVVDRKSGLFNFYVGPPKANRNKFPRGMAGETFVSGATHTTVIEASPGDDGNPVYSASNKEHFHFRGGNRHNPGFQSLITVSVPESAFGRRGVLCIDFVDFDEPPDLSPDAEAGEQSTSERSGPRELAERLGSVVAILLVAFDRLAEPSAAGESTSPGA